MALALVPCALGLFTTAFTPREVARETLSRRGELSLRWAEAHLAAPFEGYDVLDDLGASAFDVILLSNLASGLMNVATLAPERAPAMARLSEEVARRALHDTVTPLGVDGAHVGEEHLYASHALLVLAIEHRLHERAGLATSAEHDALASELARTLRRASLAHPSAHAASYPGSARWPADQAVTLAALAQHDRVTGGHLGDEPIARWLAWMAEHREDDLPWSSASPLSYQRIPRGCALSFLATYMARFSPEEGAALYRRYRERHGIDWLGWRGFREWPPGHDGGSDVDAGPVILGWGTAATGIGLGAARLYDDRAWAAGIERTADTVGLGVPLSGRYLLAPTLGQAMLFSGTTARPWDAPVPSEGSTDTGSPLGAMLSLLVVLSLQGWLLWSARAGRA